MSSTGNAIAAAMRADVEGLRVISQNIANAESTAYRRQVLVSRADFDALVNVNPADVALKTTLQSTTAIDARAGTLKSTGGALDVAIEGSGFFVVAMDGGEALTRRGDLQVDAQGVLATASGKPILGTQGVIQVGMGRASIDPDGSVRVNGDAVDRLRIAELSPQTTLRSLGEGLFQPEGDAPLVETQSARVRSGFLEASNVSAVGEMVRLMELMRHFETAQRFFRSYDDMMSSAISQLGKV